MSLNPFSASACASASTACASASTAFATECPCSKFSLNINAFNGNTTNFNRCPAPKPKSMILSPVQPKELPSSLPFPTKGRTGIIMPL